MKNSVQKKQDQTIRIFSKFVPIRSTDITQDNLYEMDINCSEQSFRDVAVGVNEFDEFEKENL